MRLARDCGDLPSLFPVGVERLSDLPYTIHNAILMALGFLSYEELPEKERPPKAIWLDEKKLKEWWAEINRIRKAEMEGHGEQGDMQQNALKDRLLIGFER